LTGLAGIRLITWDTLGQRDRKWDGAMQPICDLKRGTTGNLQAFSEIPRIHSMAPPKRTDAATSRRESQQLVRGLLEFELFAGN